MASRALGIVASILLPPLAALAQARTPVTTDTIVIRITSPRGVEVPVSGTITLRGSKTERTFDNVMTPVEVRIAREDLDVRFSADDGMALSGELARMRDGRREGHAYGTITRGTVHLFNDASTGYGFGDRRVARLFRM